MTDIVDDLRDLNSMHTPKEVFDIGEKAADEIERLRLREETLSGIIDGMTARFIEAQGAVEEIERLREENKMFWDAFQKAINEVEQLRKDKAELVKALTDLYEACRWEKVAPEIDAAQSAIAKATGGE